MNDEIKPKLSKTDWTNEVYQLLCKSLSPTNETEKRNLREFAETLAHEECGYYQDGMSPEETVEHEYSCG